jgi:hypothetical protein
MAIQAFDNLIMSLDLVMDDILSFWQNSFTCPIILIELSKEIIRKPTWINQIANKQKSRHMMKKSS